MKKVLFSIFCVVFLLTTPVFAQKQGNVWHFGQGAALDFNSGTAVVTTPSSMKTFEGCASICDENGNLLFYTNGGGRSPQLSGQTSGKIWNRNHEVMYDMSFTQGGGFSAYQSSVILPKPGEAGKYFLLTMEEAEFTSGGAVPSQPLGRGLSYFEVDMSLNSGLGGVANYTESVFLPTYEGLCAVRHSNGSDYWVIVHNDTLGLAVLPLTSAGFGTPQLVNLPGGGSAGAIKASPDGQWVSCLVRSIGQAVFPFDATTGTLGTPVLTSVIANSAEFSPDSKRLFVLDGFFEIRYFDLNAPDIAASQTLVETLEGFDFLPGQMQLAPDGKIYFLRTSFLFDSVSVNTIVCPNSAPFLEKNKFGFQVTNSESFFGLPNFDNAFFKRESDPPLMVDLGPDRVVCAGQAVDLILNFPDASYNWSNGTTAPVLSTTMPGTYTVTVTSGGCGIGIDSVVVTASALPPAPSAGTNANICAGDELSLSGSGVGTLIWSPANAVSDPTIANPMFTGDSTTALILTAVENGCSFSDTVLITVFPTPTASILPMDTIVINAGASVDLTVIGSGITFEWSPAEGLSCTNCPNPVATPDETTTYFVTVTNSDGCTASASRKIEVIPPDCTIAMPNAFTPNDDDNINKEFSPVGTAIESYNLRVFNRWGQQVYAGEVGWDGTHDGKAAPMDVYVYRINVQVCGAQSEFLGEVTLIR